MQLIVIHKATPPTDVASVLLLPCDVKVAFSEPDASSPSEAVLLMVLNLNHVSTLCQMKPLNHSNHTWPTARKLRKLCPT